MSNLQSLVAQHRAALLAREEAASREMASYYNTIWQRAYARLDELLGKMRDAQDAGTDIKVSWLYEHDRLQALLPQIAQQFDIFGQQAGLITRNLSMSAFQTGAQDAQSLLQRAFQNNAGISIAFNRLPHEAIADVVGSFQDGSPVANLFDSFGAQAALEVKNALISGVALGKNPRIIAKEIQAALADNSLARALVIARNETLRAYKSSSLASYKANSDVVDGWVWSCSFSLRTCAVCLAMNGTEHTLDEDFASHVLCRCSPIPKTKSWSALGYDGIPDTPLNIPSATDWFANLSASEQDSILGKSAGAAYRNGDVSLADFVGVKHDPTWGDSRYQKSLKDALA